MKSLKQKQRLMIILNDQSQEKTSIKQSNITTRTSTNIGTNKQNLEELKKQTLLNILSAKGVIYTYYKNNLGSNELLIGGSLITAEVRPIKQLMRKQ